MARRSWPHPRVWLARGASVAEIEDPGQADQDRAQDRVHRSWNEITGRQLRIGRQPVHFRLVDEQIEGVEPAEHLLIGAVEIRPRLASLMQLLHALLRSFAQFADRSELDRIRRTRLGAGRLQPALQPVVAERALLRGVRHRIDVDDAERAGRDAIATAVAGIRLNDDGVELGADRSEEHTSELQSLAYLVCRILLEKKKNT